MISQPPAYQIRVHLAFFEKSARCSVNDAHAVVIMQQSSHLAQYPEDSEDHCNSSNFYSYFHPTQGSQRSTRIKLNICRTCKLRMLNTRVAFDHVTSKVTG